MKTVGDLGLPSKFVISSETITNTESSGKGTLILQTINLSGASFHAFNGSALAGCPLLKTLNISWSKLTTISDGGFQSTPLL